MKDSTKKTVYMTVRDAAVVVAVSTVVALAYNALRPGEGIPLVADEEYDIFVPCPEDFGETDPVAPEDYRVAGERTLIVDAQSDEDYAEWHMEGALHAPYDWLDPVPDEILRKIARENPEAVVVYGDGGDPDTGRELALELSGGGIRNVYHVEGGAPALRAAMESSGGER